MKKLLYITLAISSFLFMNLPVGYAQLNELYVNGIGSEIVREEDFTLIITPAGGTILDISIDRNPYADTGIQLRDDQKTTLYFAHSRSDNPLFVRRFDLRELDNGTYWLYVWVGKKHIVRRVQLTSINGEHQTVLLP